MADWKSQYGVSDQGASNAGIYGTPNSTWDIARAQEETRKLQQSSWSQTSMTGIGTGYTPAPITFPTTSFPSTGYYTDSTSSGGCLKVLLALLVIGAAIALFPAYSPAVLSAASQVGLVRTLDTAHYQSLSSEATQLSAQPTSRLYTTYLSRADPEWASLSPKQQAAVAAAWIRYTRDPAAFSKLKPAQKTFVLSAFPSYLQALAATGDKHAEHDLKRFSR